MLASFSIKSSAACVNPLPVPHTPVPLDASFVVNSLLETNLGMPYIFAIFIAYSRRFTEQLSRREQTLAFTERIQEWNGQRVYDP